MRRPDPGTEVLARVRAQGLLETGRAVLVMLSGGRDSVCLLDVARRLLGPDRVSALHVNHGLRAAAEADERHCRALCRDLGVALTVRSGPPPPAGNLQAAARDVRRRAAREVAARDGALVALGHTASDQAETVLYRLAASPGRRALLGMRAQGPDGVRPLLEVTRGQTAAYCRARGLAWREDESNSDPRYARARVRHGLLSELRRVHPAAEQNLLRTVALLRDEAEVLGRVVEAELAGREEVELAHLRRLPVALARLVVRRLAEPVSRDRAAVAATRLSELLALAPRGGSASLDLGGGLRAVVTRGVLRFDRRHEGPAAPGDGEKGVGGDPRGEYGPP